MIKKTTSPVIIVLLFSFLQSCATGENNKNDDRDKPLNILIITADDLAYNSVGAFGCQVRDITPNIDRLANEGMRFMHTHITSSVCQPCRQSLMTGLYPHNNGAEGFEPINENVTTLPELLKEAGYINGILGKEIHHQPTEKFFWDYIPFRTEKDSTWRSGNSRNPDLFYKYSVRFFNMAKKENKPFFFIANSHDPHRPFATSRNDTLTWKENMPPVSRLYKTDEIEVLGYLPDIPDVRKEVTQYYNSVYRCDQNLGAVLRALQESGLEKNTLIIFLSDHGAAFPFSKAQCYLNSTKTPMIIKWPGVTKTGSTDDEHLLSIIDLMPTILESVNINYSGNLDGTSLLSLLKTGEQEVRPYVFTSFYQLFSRKRIPMRCLQNKEFGYIYNFWADGSTTMSGDATGGLTWRAMIRAAETDPEIAKRVELYKHRVREEFYNFKDDPDGLHNLIDDPAYKDEIMKFRKMMLKYMKEYNDPAYEAYRDRDKPGILEEFMESQREKAKNTKPVMHF
ncbi:MAG: sulfatase [Bacteroidales bacterium]|nr:sulfatase [Bacteroidales bacterium]